MRTTLAQEQKVKLGRFIKGKDPQSSCSLWWQCADVAQNAKNIWRNRKLRTVKRSQSQESPKKVSACCPQVIRLWCGQWKWAETWLANLNSWFEQTGASTFSPRVRELWFVCFLICFLLNESNPHLINTFDVYFGYLWLIVTLFNVLNPVTG